MQNWIYIYIYIRKRRIILSTDFQMDSLFGKRVKKIDEIGTPLY